MLVIVNDLATYQDNRSAVGATLLCALDLQPQFGPRLEPKEWREEVKTCLWQLYQVDETKVSLLALMDPVADHMYALLRDLFSEPLTLIGPVLDAKVSFEVYLPIACSSLEATLDTCESYIMIGSTALCVWNHSTRIFRVQVALTVPERVTQGYQNRLEC